MIADTLELHIALAYITVVGPQPTPRTPRPPNYKEFLTLVRRRASYVVMHGVRNYLRALQEEPPTPTPEHREFLENYRVAKHYQPGAELAKALQIPAKRIQDILDRARGQYVAHGHRAPLTKDELAAMKNVADHWPWFHIDPEPPTEEPPSNAPSNATAIIRHVARTMAKKDLIQDPPHPRKNAWPDNAEDCLIHVAGREDLVQNRRCDIATKLGISKRTLQRRTATLQQRGKSPEVARIDAITIGIVAPKWGGDKTDQLGFGLLGK